MAEDYRFKKIQAFPYTSLLPAIEYFQDENGKIYGKKRDKQTALRNLIYDSLDDIEYTYADPANRPTDYGHHRIVLVNNGRGGYDTYLAPIYTTKAPIVLPTVIEDPMGASLAQDTPSVDTSTNGNTSTNTSSPRRTPTRKNVPEEIKRIPGVVEVDEDGNAKISIPGNPEVISRIIGEALGPASQPTLKYVPYKRPTQNPTDKSIPVETVSEEEENPGFMSRLFGGRRNSRKETRKVYAYPHKKVHTYIVPIDKVLDIVNRTSNLQGSDSDSERDYIFTTLKVPGFSVGLTMNDTVYHYVPAGNAELVMVTSSAYGDRRLNGIPKTAGPYLMHGTYDNGYARIYNDDAEGEYESRLDGEWMFNINGNYGNGLSIFLTESGEELLSNQQVNNKIALAFLNPNEEFYSGFPTVAELRRRGYTDSTIKDIIRNLLYHNYMSEDSSGLISNYVPLNVVWNLAMRRFGGTLNYLNLF